MAMKSPTRFTKVSMQRIKGIPYEQSVIQSGFKKMCLKLLKRLKYEISYIILIYDISYNTNDSNKLRKIWGVFTF